MRIDVALVPAEARRWRPAVRIVIDQLRASSTIVRLLGSGATPVIPAASLGEARRIARTIGPSALLVGEHRVVRAPGFDFGNEPAAISGADLAGRVAVVSSRNGTAVLRDQPPGEPVYIGCLLNAGAVGRAAYGRALAGGLDLGIVCAGRVGSFALDDAIAAGAILERILAAAGLDADELPTVDGWQDPRRPAPDPDDPAGGRGASLVLTDAARAALLMWRSTTDVEAVFRASFSGHLLASHDLMADLGASLPVDAVEVVPVLVPASPPRIEAARG